MPNHMFEIIHSAGTGVDDIRFPSDYLDVIEELFEGRVFDMHTVSDVLPLLDAARAKLQSDPDQFRILLGHGTLRQLRAMLENIREVLVIFPDATVSGPLER